MKKKIATWIKGETGNDIPMNRKARRSVEAQTGEWHPPKIVPFKKIKQEA